MSKKIPKECWQGVRVSEQGALSISAADALKKPVVQKQLEAVKRIRLASDHKNAFVPFDAEIEVLRWPKL